MNFKILIFLSVVLFSCGSDDNSEYEKYLEKETEFNFKASKGLFKDIKSSVSERGNIVYDLKNLNKLDSILSFIPKLKSLEVDNKTIFLKKYLDMIDHQYQYLPFFRVKHSVQENIDELPIHIFKNKISRSIYELTIRTSISIGHDDYRVRDLLINYKKDDSGNVKIFVNTKIKGWAPEFNVGDSTYNLDSNWTYKLLYKKVRGKKVELIMTKPMTGKKEIVSTKIIN